MNDTTIEQAIVAAGKTAPRVTPADIEANISAEYFFTAEKATKGCPQLPSLALLTFCVVVLKNGFTVTGESACASPENFDAAIGKRIARDNAIAKIWPLMGYALKEKLARRAEFGTSAAPAISQLTIAAECCESSAPIHAAEGNHEQAKCSRDNAAAYRVAIERLQA